MPFELLDEVSESVAVKPEPEQEGYGQAALRNITAGLSKGAAGFAGVPRGILDLINAASQKLSPLSPEQQQALQQEMQSGSPQAQELAQFGLGGTLPEVLPTTETVKETIGEVLPEGYLEPKNELERVGQEAAEDIGSLLFPLGGATKLTRAAKIAGAGNIAKYLTKRVGGSEAMQEGAKVGTMLLTSFKMQPQIKEKASKMFDAARNAIPEGKAIKTASLEKTINQIEKEWARSGFKGRGSKKFVAERINEIKDLIGGDRMKLNDGLNFVTDINEAISEASRQGYKDAVPKLIEMKDSLINTFINSKDVPKSVSEPLKAARSIWRDVSSAEKAVNNITNTLKKNKGSLTGLGLLGVGSVLTSKDPMKKAQTLAKGAIGGAVLAFGASKATQLGYAAKHLMTNKHIRNEYAKMMNAAVKGSSGGIVKSANKLNKLIEKETEKSPMKETSGRYELLD